MGDLTALPTDLPVPDDDGAADHLTGLELPEVRLPSHDGGTRPLRSNPLLVLYVYPRTGGPGVDLPDDWDAIPGARGCTPQGCAFRDHHEELRQLGAAVFGLSAQSAGEQRDFAVRMHIPFPLLNDAALLLAAPPLRLPTFTVGALTSYKRTTLVAQSNRIAKVFYPVFPPDRNAADVLDHLTGANDA